MVLVPLRLPMLATVELPALLVLVLEVVWSPEVFLLAGLSSGPAALRVLRRGRVGAPGGCRPCLVVVAGRRGLLLLLLLLLNPGISLELLVTVAATGSLGESLGLGLASKLLLLQQEVRGRRGEERNSLLESRRELSSVTKGRGTTVGILRHS